MDEGCSAGVGDLSGRVQAGWLSARRARLGAAAPRYLASAVLFGFFAIGLRTAFLSPAVSAPSRPPLRGADAPSEDFALQFARAYLTYDAADPSLRERALAPFLSQGLAADGGFSAAAGAQRVLWAEVASDQRALTGGRLITVAAQLSTQSLPVYLAVSVRHEAGQSLELLGYPALIGAPAIDSSYSPPARSAVTDPAVLEVVDRVIHNYLAGDAAELKADLSVDATVTLPTQRLALQSVEQTLWVGGRGSGAVLLTAAATDPRGNTYTFTYELGIVYRERPYVDFIEVVPTAS